MKMKKIVGFGIASVMALTMAMGFTAAAADYEECTLKFAWWGGDSRHEVTQQAVNAFMEKYPGINVEVNFAHGQTGNPREHLSSSPEQRRTSTRST